ncbi:hypothetical protein BOS5A_80057 [Bosea sp. EC-HK365B]|nr:hypothetical protein BOSE21B_111450 [Bosea sp. 21B]CAD5270310.1 hypothetical protein BOSE7B_20189 [Bosea sp. 7B]VVT62397.1 hypothetical protein BOS5A_80057 [Bosea sp. EC-HK365B]VXC65563.1 hypothetical protein BOSE127_30203 [Bosea sp. 127]
MRSCVAPGPVLLRGDSTAGGMLSEIPELWYFWQLIEQITYTDCPFGQEPRWSSKSPNMSPTRLIGP